VLRAKRADTRRGSSVRYRELRAVAARAFPPSRGSLWRLRLARERAAEVGVT